MRLEFSCILFDLDGTIVDSAPGITGTILYTFEKLGLPAPNSDELRAYIGPPILDSFHEISHLTPVQAARALVIYREKYLNDGAYDAALYVGVAEVLEAIHHSPIHLSLATSKPELPATLMLEHFTVAQFFDVITGASADEVRSAKADVVEEALRRLRKRGADVSKPVMVGDRSHDVLGAAAHGVPTIFVEWGYGTQAEQDGALAVVSTAAELQQLLLG